MEHILVLVVIYLGLLAGYIISKFTKQELKNNKKNLVLSKSIFFGLIFWLFLLDSGFNHLAAAPFSVMIFFITWIWLYRFNSVYVEMFISALLGGIFAVSFHPSLSIMIFGFFLVSASLDYKKKYYFVFGPRIFFLVIGILARTLYLG